MTEDADRDVTITHPEVRCGEWFGDKWTSAYIRADFELGPGAHCLLLELFSPTGMGGARAVVIRMGAVALARLDFSDTRRKISWRHEWRTGCSEPETVSISISASDIYTPDGQDRRQLGVVALDWRVETRPGGDCSDGNEISSEEKAT